MTPDPRSPTPHSTVPREQWLVAYRALLQEESGEPLYNVGTLPPGCRIVRG